MQRFNVLVGFVLAVVLLVLAFVLHLPEGWPRLAMFGGAAAVFCLCAFAWKPGRLNAIALPLLICLPEWRWLVLVLLVVAAAVAIAYGLYYALRKAYGAWPG